MIVAFTGHRPDKLGGEYLKQYAPHTLLDQYGPISSRIFHEIQAYLKHVKATKVISGMALGVDMIAAHAALYMDIPVIAAIPFIGQEGKWPEHTKQWYKYFLEQVSEKHVVCEGGYAPWKMQKRNEWMVDNCDILVGVWDGSAGGTRNCLEYSKKVGKETKIIDI